MLLSEIDDVESFFSEQEDYDEQTAFVLVETEDHSESDNVSIIQTVQQFKKFNQPFISLQSKSTFSPVDLINQFPSSVLLILELRRVCLILQSHFWEKHTKYFKATNGELFHTNLITKKPIGVQFFPGCILWIKLVGSNLPDKYLLIEFDVPHLVKKLYITASGIRYK